MSIRTKMTSHAQQYAPQKSMAACAAIAYIHKNANKISKLNNWHSYCDK